MRYHERNVKESSEEPQKLQKRKLSGAKKRAIRAKKRRRRFLIFTLEAVVLCVLLFVLYVQGLWDTIPKEMVAKEDQVTNAIDANAKQSMKGYMNIALFGVDARDNTTLGKGTHADADMICSINMSTGEIRLVSVYRDTYLNIKDETVFNKLTQAYFEGGPSQAVRALNKNLDLNITDYITINWKAVADAINILGGIELEITESEFSQINGFVTEVVKSTGVPSSPVKSAGMNHLDGAQAVAYARLRLMDTDYKRTERQRKVIELALQKAKEADAKTVLQLVNTVFPQVLTSMKQKDVLDLSKNTTRYHIGVTAGFPFDKQAKIVGKRGDCVVPLGLAQNVKQLHEFLFATEGYIPSATILELDQKIKEDTGLQEP